MYKINNSIDFSSLKDDEAIQVCVGMYSVGLCFLKGLLINIQGTYNLRKSGSILFKGSGEDPNENKNLVCLLGRSIESTKILGDNVLSIYFSDDYCLELIDDSEQYESFIIKNKTLEVII
jgi:hypothetical protein